MLTPEQCFDVWSKDFISGLQHSQSYNSIYTFINKFTKFVQLIPYFKGKGALSAPEYATFFFDCLVYQKWCYITIIQGLHLTFGRLYGY